jgi:hypothetical protein
MNTTLGIILGIIGFIVIMFVLALIGSGLNLITIPWLKFDSQVNMNRDIVTKTYNADNAIYNYHWFQETAGQLKAYQTNLTDAQQAVTDFKTNAKGDMSTWSYAETTEYARLNAVAQGIGQEYNNLANEYNAKAGEADKSMFVNGLPTFFNLQPF